MRTVVQSTISKLGLRKLKEIPYADIIDWANGALCMIGGLSQYEEITGYKLEVVDNRAKLPKNLYEITNCSSKPFKTKLDSIIVKDTNADITIDYIALPLDEEGWPLVPDDESYMEAIMWRVAKFMAIRDELPNKKLSPEYCQRKWQWYCGQARAEAIAPTPDQVERMANVFRRLVPMSDEFNQDFAGLNHRENLFRHDNQGTRFN